MGVAGTGRACGGAIGAAIVGAMLQPIGAMLQPIGAMLQPIGAKFTGNKLAPFGATAPGAPQELDIDIDGQAAKGSAVMCKWTCVVPAVAGSSAGRGSICAGTTAEVPDGAAFAGRWCAWAGAAASAPGAGAAVAAPAAA
jgi:hypothetical protein